MDVRFTNTGDVPLSLAVFLATDNYDYNSEPDTISATTLLKPLRQIILPSRLPNEQGLVSLPDMMKNRIGSAIHDSIEQAWKNNYQGAMKALGYPSCLIKRIRINPEPGTLEDGQIPIYLEQRLSRKVGKWTITGKFDFIGEGRVQDFKSTSTWAYMSQANATKFTQQGSIYRWLDPKLITQDEMDIIYIFTDWKAAMVRTDPKYPPQQFKKQVYPLLSEAEVDAFIRNKVRQIETYWNAPEEEIPFCDNDDLWRSEPVYKYYKNGDINSKRSTKNFETNQEAVIYMSTEHGGKGAIKEVPGQVTACKYCPSFAICTQKDSLIQAGDLVMA
jgi:hypothetical protein